MTPLVGSAVRLGAQFGFAPSTAAQGITVEPTARAIQVRDRRSACSSRSHWWVLKRWAPDNGVLSTRPDAHGSDY